MTVHSSKGLEYPAVHVTDIDDSSYGANRPFAYDQRGLELLPPEVLNTTASEFMYEERIERNNLLYVALSRARDYLYLYEISGWQRPVPLNCASATSLVKRAGIKAPPPQLNAISLTRSKVLPIVSYEAFNVYMNCPLQYRYRYELSLTAEQDIDASIRARWAVMDTLLAVAKDGTSFSTAFQAAWTSRGLPGEEDDPGLIDDAIVAAKRGIAVVGSVCGTVEDSMVSEVNGIRIELPWMLSVKGQLHWIRAQTTVQYTLSHLRPMMLNINGSQIPSATIYSIITDEQIKGVPSNR